MVLVALGFIFQTLSLISAFAIQNDVPEQPSFSALVEVRLNSATWRAWAKLHEAILVPTNSKDETTFIGNDVPFEVRPIRKQSREPIH